MQLPLPFQHVVNENSFPTLYGRNNRLIFLELCAQFKQPGRAAFYLLGSAGQGKTHFLKATCASMTEQGYACAYFPLKMLANFSQKIQASRTLHLIALDDIDAIARIDYWEENLFHLFNRMQLGIPPYLLISGQRTPTDLELQLPDLTSRLSGSGLYRLQSLPLETLEHAFLERARMRGVALSPRAAKTLLATFAGQPSRLFQQLDHIAFSKAHPFMRLKN